MYISFEVEKEGRKMRITLEGDYGLTMDLFDDLISSSYDRPSGLRDATSDGRELGTPYTIVQPVSESEESNASNPE